MRLRDYKKIDKYSEKSNIIYFETDCKKFKTRFLKDMYFEDHMGMGKSKILNEVVIDYNSTKFYRRIF